MSRRRAVAALLAALAAGLAGCGGDGEEGGEARRGGPPGAGGAPWGGAPGGAPAAAVPVEVAPVERRDISSYIETNGTLEAENEVDVEARVSGPIVELGAEEGMRVARGRVLARIEDDEIRAQLEVARVALEEARLAWERAQNLDASQLISAEAFEQARNRFETARAQLEGNQIQLGYTVIRAPFDGVLVARYVDLAEQVGPGTPLFRISDFTPLLCPIQVPERELPRLSVGQGAYLTVEAWPGRRFAARVLRIRPVVDAATGTVRVTLEVDGQGDLTPGMFARVFLETATRRGALVIPKTALLLEAIGDVVYVAADGVAQRREIEVGFREGDSVEVLRGLAEEESVVVVGQDGLSDGAPVQVMGVPGAFSPRAAGTGGGPPAAGAPGFQPPAGGPASGFDPSKMTPEQLERLKATMKARGLSDEEIERRLERMRQRAGGG